MKNDAWIVELRWWAEDKTGIGETKTENEGDCLSDIIAITIWVPGSGNFFLGEMVRKLYINLPQCLLVESAVLFSVNFVVLTASSFSTFQHQMSNLQLVLLTLLLTKTVQQSFELTVSLTQFVAFLNCCTLLSLLLTFQVTQNACLSSLLGSCITSWSPCLSLLLSWGCYKGDFRVMSEC